MVCDGGGDFDNIRNRNVTQNRSLQLTSFRNWGGWAVISRGGFAPAYFLMVLLKTMVSECSENGTFYSFQQRIYPSILVF
jgi:hypothetical protein